MLKYWLYPFRNCTKTFFIHYYHMVSSFFEYCVTRVGGALVNLLHLSLLIDIFELIFFKLNSFLWLRIFIFFICGWCFVQNSRKSGYIPCMLQICLSCNCFFLSIRADDKAQRHHARQDLVMSEGIVFPLIILVLLGSQEGSIFTLQL